MPVDYYKNVIEVDINFEEREIHLKDDDGYVRHIHHPKILNLVPSIKDPKKIEICIQT